MCVSNLGICYFGPQINWALAREGLVEGDTGKYGEEGYSHVRTRWADLHITYV